MSNLKNWDGYSRSGQSEYDELFKQEMRQAEQLNPFDYMTDEWFEHEISRGEEHDRKNKLSS